MKAEKQGFEGMIIVVTDILVTFGSCYAGQTSRSQNVTGFIPADCRMVFQRLSEL